MNVNECCSAYITVSWNFGLSREVAVFSLRVGDPCALCCVVGVATEAIIPESALGLVGRWTGTWCTGEPRYRRIGGVFFDDT